MAGSRTERSRSEKIVHERSLDILDLKTGTLHHGSISNAGLVLNSYNWCIWYLVPGTGREQGDKGTALPRDARKAEACGGVVVVVALAKNGGQT